MNFRLKRTRFDDLFPGLTLLDALFRSSRQAKMARIAVSAAHDCLLLSIFNARDVNRSPVWRHVRSLPLPPQLERMRFSPRIFVCFQGFFTLVIGLKYSRSILVCISKGCLVPQEAPIVQPGWSIGVQQIVEIRSHYGLWWLEKLSRSRMDLCLRKRCCLQTNRPPSLYSWQKSSKLTIHGVI